MRFAGKVALITGATRGIGRAAADAFAAEGAKVAVLGRDEDHGLQVSSEVIARGCEACWIRADVSRDDEVARAIRLVDERWGRLDVLVNNAAILIRGTVLDTAPVQWAEILNVNLTGPYLLSRHAIPLMLRSGGGSIVNISSEAGLVGIRNLTAYNVSKAGLIALSRSMAVDFAAQGIRVNCVCPGTTLTPMVEAMAARTGDPQAEFKRLGDARPMKRLGAPREIVSAILHLASDESSYTTGAVLSVDGGYAAQ
jgi:NAD(P)-dependent dehydrogenase (short-subunit alcohol dehydrogenase family)